MAGESGVRLCGELVGLTVKRDMVEKKRIQKVE